MKIIKVYDCYPKNISIIFILFQIALLLVETKDNSQITLIINGSGYQSLFHERFTEKPNEIYVNGQKTEFISGTMINLTLEVNTIIIKWNFTLTNCSYMFSGKKNIIEIDLSQFDTSLVKSMDHMFMNCSSLTSINLTSFNTSQVTTSCSMFNGCSSLSSIDLSNFDTSNNVNLGNMFNGCSSLTSLDLSNFNTHNVRHMDYMFNKCLNITYLDLSVFDTSSVKGSHYMFSGCSQLTYLNVSNFDTSSATQMQYLFNGCKSLVSLNIYNFNTKKVTDMKFMFAECESLTSLNLSHFDTSEINDMRNMFNGCSNLTFLDLSNFNFSSIKDQNNIANMFQSCNKLEHINLMNATIILEYFLNNQDLKTIFEGLVICTSLNNNMIINEKECEILNCSGNIKENQTEIDSYNNQCVKIKQCNLTKFNFQYENKCYLECPDGTSPIGTDPGICVKNSKETNIVKIISEIPQRISTIITQYISYEQSTLIGFETSNQVIIESKSEAKIDMSTKSLTEEITEKIMTEKIYDSNKDNIINTYYTEILITEMNNEYICDINDFLNYKCKNIYKNKEDQKEFSNNIINQIMNGTLTKLLNSLVKENKSIIIEEENAIHQISTLSNQKEIENYTSINFGDCEKYLKEKYGIKETEELIIYKIEHIIEGYKIPIIEYVIFNEDGSKKLNLDCCNNITIKYNIPVSINENDLDKYNTSSDYYNNECIKTESNEGIDMTLYD